MKEELESMIEDIEVINEAGNTSTPEYNVDMSEIQAKRTLGTVSGEWLRKLEKDKKAKFSQYTANIYANVITKNLLPKWSEFKKLKITLDSYQSFHTLEFIPPTIGQDFVSRFMHNRETIHSMIHRTPEIRIKMSPRIFHTMKDQDDAYYFFRAAIKYYDSKMEKVGSRLLMEISKLGHTMKHLVSTTKLSGLVTYPLSLLFIFSDVDMSNKDAFKIKDEDIQTINRFVRTIASKYASPEKEKKQIIEDVKEMVRSLRESADNTKTMRELSYLPEAVEQYLMGGFCNQINEAIELFAEDNIDRDFKPTGELKHFYEFFGQKKLKKIPRDLIAYVQIEGESVKSSNDKYMICSYIQSKIEIVEWYLELLEAQAQGVKSKYVVPHDKPYLIWMRTELLKSYSTILKTPIPKANSPILSIPGGYPAGYEG